MRVTGKSSASPQAIQPSGRTVSETWYVRQRISQWQRFARKQESNLANHGNAAMRYGFKGGFRHSYVSGLK
jgi:hypothetical protein